MAQGNRPEESAMSLDGIWTGEVYGPFGWENRGVFLLENGRIVGGDNRQYSVGTYSESGDEVTAELKTHYYGPPRTVFGENREEFTTKIVGTRKNHEIDGTISRPDKPQFDLQMRLTKRLELPLAPAR
jgi:hypothetical protein